MNENPQQLNPCQYRYPEFHLPSLRGWSTLHLPSLAKMLHIKCSNRLTNIIIILFIFLTNLFELEEGFLKFLKDVVFRYKYQKFRFHLKNMNTINQWLKGILLLNHPNRNLIYFFNLVLYIKLKWCKSFDSILYCGSLSCCLIICSLSLLPGFLCYSPYNLIIPTHARLGL